MPRTAAFDSSISKAVIPLSADGVEKVGLEDVVRS
jgi:hypothetical protein